MAKWQLDQAVDVVGRAKKKVTARAGMAGCETIDKAAVLCTSATGGRAGRGHDDSAGEYEPASVQFRGNERRHAGGRPSPKVTRGMRTHGSWERQPVQSAVTCDAGPAWLLYGGMTGGGGDAGPVVAVS